MGYEEYEVKAFALDPSSTLPGMASKVNRHYINRFVLPVAAAFIESLGNTVGETKSEQSTGLGGVQTETTEEKSSSKELWTAVGDAGTVVRGLIEESVKDGPTIRVFAGSEMGILFIESVYGDNDRGK
jgi:intracellular multiplication protein IcmE